MTKKKNKQTAFVDSATLHMGCSVLCRRGLLECPGGPAVLAAPPTGLLLLARLLEYRNIFRGELVVLFFHFVEVLEIKSLFVMSQKGC